MDCDLFIVMGWIDGTGSHIGRFTGKSVEGRSDTIGNGSPSVVSATGLSAAGNVGFYTYRDEYVYRYGMGYREGKSFLSILRN